jgi:hypothetical protein
MALLALALRYRTTAERGFYKALAELHKLRAVIRENLIRQRTEVEREYKAASATEGNSEPSPGPRKRLCSGHLRD